MLMQQRLTALQQSLMPTARLCCRLPLLQTMKCSSLSQTGTMQLLRLARGGLPLLNTLRCYMSRTCISYQRRLLQIFKNVRHYNIQWDAILEHGGELIGTLLHQQMFQPPDVKSHPRNTKTTAILCAPFIHLLHATQRLQHCNEQVRQAD